MSAYPSFLWIWEGTALAFTIPMIVGDYEIDVAYMLEIRFILAISN
jgi:hypothetical protein